MSASKIHFSLLYIFQGTCSREGCKRPRARNCRTGEIHEFCSLTCKHWEIIKPPDSKTFEAGIDPAMDMLIALEMSKLQLLEKCSEYSNGDESAVDATFGNSAEFTEQEGISESTNLETSEKSANFSAEFGLEQNSDVHHDSVHEHVSDSYSDIKDVELVEYDSQKSAINFYLKNSCCDDSKNINVNSDINDSKTEKELFKMLQRTAENENENFTCKTKEETHCN
ncbi:uncharacterized protein LOC118203769 isoform X2 [Stegodyphus dumicola]|uniref:uncharacterized protein LOC118203769 isoform X2 n=1 Tax=Stegodyphus dumicola TaxID=202533 RepID=UPI0015A80270|nr:uncharacterized protein LOC118203769 isoform X2 [Stegodyphus dumicola]